MHIKQLKINNLRSFESATLDFNLPELQPPSLQYPNVNVLLGDNGLGKTSVLRSVAMAILSPLLSSSSGFVPEGFIRRPPEAPIDGMITMHIPEPATLEALVISTYEETALKNQAWSLPVQFEIQTEISPMGSAERLRWKMQPKDAAESIEQIQFDDDNPAFFVVGYSATRRVEASIRVDESARTKSRLARYERVASLFEDHLALMPLSYWLPTFEKTNKGRYTQVINLINELLPPSCQIQKKATQTLFGHEHLFRMNDVILPFRALSDGFKGYIGWIGDMLFHVCRSVGTGLKLREMRGVVMVDEIDLHLHPEWQKVVVPTLAKALPNVQFIFTTHSPLVVGSLSSQNLFVLEQENDATVVKRLPEHVQGKSSEQILLSPYFGLESTRSESTASKLTSLARSAVAGDPEASMQYLQVLAKGLGLAAKKPKSKTKSKIKSPLPPRKIEGADS